MPIRPGALPHTVNITRRLADGTEDAGATGIRVRIDPEAGSEPEDVDEADFLVILEPAADGLFDGGDVLGWVERELDLEAKGPPLPFYDGRGILHHLEASAQLAPGFPDTIGVYYLGQRSAGALNLTTADFAPASTPAFSTPARIRRAGAGGSDVLIGDDPAVLTAWMLTTPYVLDSLGIHVEDRVVVTGSKTATLIGVTFRVAALGNADPHHGRSYLLERIDEALEAI